MKRKSIFTFCAIALMFVLSLSVLTACNKNKHEFSSEWKFDETNHWHECTTKKHTDTSEILPHEFKEEIVKAADYGVVGEKKFTCKDCGYSYTEDIDALGAKDNEIVLVAGKTLGKEYDGEVVSITKDDFVIEGNRAPTIMFKVKGADDNTYTATAPKNAGKYTVKVSVKATAEWKAATKTFDFEISKKELTGTATKVYDGNATMPATLTGIVAGETVSATITMDSKNVDATVKEVVLAGADKDNYVIDKTKVTASITPMIISVEWEHPYDNTNILTGEPAELLAGDEATITVTMNSANVGATVQSFEITGKDAGNYSLVEENVTVNIVKADINFEISNASALTEFFVGATNIPDPTTDYEEIGTGYGEKTIVWEKQLEDGVWSRTLTKEEVRNLKSGEYRVRIQYAKGDNYNFGATDYVYFTVKAKSRSLTVKNFTGKTYDGKPVENFTYEKLVDIVHISEIPGVTDITSPYDGEKYAEFRRKGEVLWTTVTDTYVPKNAAEYEYRIGIKATDEWAATVSETKTLTIAQVEIKLEWGYTLSTYLLQSGGLVHLAEYEPVAGEKVVLRLVNGKAGLELDPTNASYVKQDQKKQVSVQDNLDCFILTATTNANVNNYKIVKSVSYQTSVEITVPPAANGASNAIQGAWKTTDELYIETSVKVGYFKVGQTVMVYDSTGTKLLEAKIVKVNVMIDGSARESLSGCVIPSDGTVRIDIDITGITYSGTLKGGTVKVK